MIFVYLDYFATESDHCHQDWLVLVIHLESNGIVEVFNDVWNVFDSPYGCKTSSLPDIGRRRLHELLNFRIEISAHKFCGTLSDCCQTQRNNKCFFRVQILFDWVGDHHQDICWLIQELWYPKITNSFFSIAWRRYQLNTFNLSKLSGIPEQIEEQQLSNVPVSMVTFFLLICVSIN